MAADTDSDADADATVCSSGETFAGRDDCTEDCSEHETRYELAEDNGVMDPDNCGGNSQSLSECCGA